MFDTLSIDWGSVRCGIALGDSKTSLIIPHTKPVNTDDIYTVIAELIEHNSITCIVVGYPSTFLGKKTEVSQAIESFVYTLKTHSTVPVIYYDERYTTQHAHTTLTASSQHHPNNTRKSSTSSSYISAKDLALTHNKHLINHAAAASLLTHYFDQNKK